jgi:uncharacterized protein
MMDGNQLRHEHSPYLLQHAGNPVHWRPWGPAALEAARATNRPILLSIGYAACHWCHVMAHESFEDPETAALMNQLYVNIKVDREERPDIDHIYMSALHALGEQGGWPLTMFLTPDGAPFWGGTYFPPEPRWGRPSFRQVLHGIAEAWHGKEDAVSRNAAALQRALAGMAATQPGDLPGPDALDQAGNALLAMVDPERGGLRGAPKFPNAPIFRFLWQESFRRGDASIAAPVHRLLHAMSQGGIYDHLGGGFSRYSTDAEWLVPHFEKMLYDNAQILELLAFAQADRADPLYAARAAETVLWLQRDMRATSLPNGTSAFAASEDADSEGEEGRFYVWTEAEVDALLGRDAPAFKSAYDVTPAGNWEGRTIFRRIAPPGDAKREEELARSRARLFEARARRVRPARDDKVLADWNGLAIAALCRAGVVFERPDWVARAAAACDAVLAALPSPDGRVQHAWRNFHVTAAGLLDDQAAMGRATLALFEATGATERLDQAIRLAEAILRHFADTDGSLYTTSDDAADLPAARPRHAADSATPSGTGLAAELFARLHHLTGEPRWRRHAEAAIRAHAGAAERLAAMPGLLAAADFLENAAVIVVTGDPESPAAAALLAAALAAPDPATCVLRAPRPASLQPEHPAFGKAEALLGPAAFLCRAGTCSLPISDPDALRDRLRGRLVPPDHAASGPTA